MAVQFTNDGEVIRLVQTRKVFRVVGMIVAIGWVFGAAMMVFTSLHATATSLVCDHAAEQCTLRRGAHEDVFAASSLVDVSLKESGPDVYVSVEADAAPRFHAICGTDGAAAAPLRKFVDEVAAFRGDVAHAPVRLDCLGRQVGGPNVLVVLPVSLLGWLLVVLLTFQFSEETRVVIDRRAGTIEASGRRWFRRPWDVRRPLADVVAIEQDRRYAGRGQYQYSVRAAFNDDTTVLLWSPSGAWVATIEDRVAQMRALVGQKPA